MKAIHLFEVPDRGGGDEKGAKGAHKKSYYEAQNAMKPPECAHRAGKNINSHLELALRGG